MRQIQSQQYTFEELEEWKGGITYLHKLQSQEEVILPRMQKEENRGHVRRNNGQELPQKQRDCREQIYPPLTDNVCMRRQ